MKDPKYSAQKLFTLMLSVMLCFALMPVSTFALEDAATCEHVLETVEAVEATCQHTGHLAYRQCTKCGTVFDAIENKEVDYQTLVTPIADHKWVKSAEVPATEAQDGKITYTCSVCGTSYDEATHYVPTPPTGKSFTLGDNKVKFKSAVVKKVPSFMKTARINHVWIKAYKKKMKISWDPAENMTNVDGVIILRRDGKNKTYKEIKRLAYRKADSGVQQWDPKFAYMDKTAKKKNTAYTYIVVSYKVENGYAYISNCSDWASGQTTSGKLKNAYKAKITKSADTLQYNDKEKIRVWQSKPKKYFNPYSVRWYSDNKKVAKVSSKGNITAVSPGVTTIRARLASGWDVTCEVTVIGAFEPKAPKLKLDYATESSISLIWNPVQHATAYDLYRSDDGLHWNDPIRVKKTSKKITGLAKGHRYTFYVEAVNVNGPYTAKSSNSNVLNQKAIVKRRKTSVTGWPDSKTLAAGGTYTVYLKITSPSHRKAQLQLLKDNNWVTMKTVTLPSGAAKTSASIVFPNDWWGKTTEWRLIIPQSSTAEKYTSKTLTIKSSRKYQNPAKYVQIGDTISKHGYSYYVSPVLVNSTSTKADHVEALIKTANKYKGDSYINTKSGAPGNGIDASGLVIQSCYGAGVDLWPISPSTRPYNCVPKIMDSKLAHITYTADHVNMVRGDLIFFQISEGNYGHVAIYTGLGNIIHASPVTGKVENSTIEELIKPVEEGGKYGYPEDKIKVRRIFN